MSFSILLKKQTTVMDIFCMVSDLNDLIYLAIGFGIGLQLPMHNRST